MKRFIALFLSCLLVLSFALTSCGKKDDTTNKPADSSKPAASNAGDATTPASKDADTPTVSDDASVTTINVYAFTEEVPSMVQKYLDDHPDVKLKMKKTVVPTTKQQYQPALDAALQGGGESAPDIYCAEAAFVKKYTIGEGASYAAAYKDLGIDVDNKIKEGEVAQYSVDIGTNEAGSVVALGYQATGGAFIYRRSIARDVWGTDDPKVIKEKMGTDWDGFFKAAADLKAKGYGVVSGDGDIWHAVENSSDQGWVVDGKLVIDPKREAFLDYSKKLKDNNWHNDTQDWQPAWFTDMAGKGPQPIFGFFGPAWLVNYKMVEQCGGTKIGEGTFGDWAICDPVIGFFWGGSWVFANKSTKIPATVGKIIEWITLDSSDTGLQYLWANGMLNKTKTKDAVAINTVLARSDGKVDFLNGQNMFEVFIPASKYADGKKLTQYDEAINALYRDATRQYTAGKKSKEQTLADFKKQVGNTFDITVE